MTPKSPVLLLIHYQLAANIKADDVFRTQKHRGGGGGGGWGGLRVNIMIIMFI